MLVDIYPRFHARISSLPLLGPLAEEFVVWLHAVGYTRFPICLRVRALPRVDARLRRRGVRRLEDLSRAELLALAPRDSQGDVYLAAVVRSLALFLDERDGLARSTPTRSQLLVREYRDHLEQVRGLAETTMTHHASTVSELLAFLGYDADTRLPRRLEIRQIDAFLATISPRVCRESLQHVVAHLRSFLRFLVGRGEIADGVQREIDTPRVYRGERLPRSLPWKTVEQFLAAIDRSTPMGRRDYAMFLLITTYGLRTSEVAALRLDDIEWRAGRLRVPRPKMKMPIVLPLTKEVGAAIAIYLRRDRPDLPHREVFLRVRAPAGVLKPTAVTEAFQTWTRRGHLPIPYQGPHCLRHSLAVHLLRRGTSIKAIGDLLGHRSAEATCVYLRLAVDDLRDAALEVPGEVRP
ncbi:MAG: site-specific integrase [Gaiellaceae bacterium]